VRSRLLFESWLHETSSMTAPRRESDRQELALFIRKLAIIGAAIALAFVLWHARRVLIIVFVAAVLAAGIAPAVRRVRILFRLYTKRRMARGTAVLVVYLPFLVSVGLFLFLAVPRLMSESKELSVKLPVLIDEKILSRVDDYVSVDEARKVIRENRLFENVPVFDYLKSAVTLVTSIVAILFMMVYMLIDAERLRNFFLLFYPASERAAKRNMVKRVSRRMSRWLSGQLLLALIIGAATFVALLSLRIPYALPLAILAAVGETVPVIGPIIGAIPAVAVALFQSEWQFWAVIALAILIQQFENYLLVPRIMGKKVQISPLAVFIAFLMGGSLLGIVGAIMALPAAAILQVIFNEVFVQPRERRQNTGRPGTLLKGDE